MRSSLARFHCEIGLGDGAEARARVTRASATRRQKAAVVEWPVGLTTLRYAQTIGVW
jgi:hypothetical protein